MISRPRISSSRRPPRAGESPRNDSARDFGKSVSEREEVGGEEERGGTNEISRGAKGASLVGNSWVILVSYPRDWPKVYNYLTSPDLI